MTLPLLEPALEELLREVAADPRSNLLRVDRPSLLKGPFDHDPMVRESCTGLRSAERELLRVYRQELGLALRECCFDIVYHREELDVYLFADHGSEAFPHHREYIEASEASRKLAEMHGNRRLRRLVIQATGSTSPRDLAILACRVNPTSNGYLLLSDAYEIEGEPQLERRAIDRARKLVSSQQDRAHAFSYTGFALSVDERHEESISAYKAAFQSGGVWPNEVLSWISLAVQCKSESWFSEADDLIQHPSISNASIAQWTTDQLQRRLMGYWSIQPGAAGFASRHINRASERASHVLQRLFLS